MYNAIVLSTRSSVGYEESSFSRGNTHVFPASGHILDKDSAAIDALVQQLAVIWLSVPPPLRVRIIEQVRDARRTEGEGK